jgi:biofilm PGA synthesis protein PgaD
MAYSRPRLPKIIERADLEPKGRRYLGRLINLLGWAIWTYLFTPLIALIGWFLGFELFQRHILDDPMGTLRAIQTYAIIIVSAAVIFIGWAGYNWLRYHGKQRRHAPAAVGTEELASHFGIASEDARKIAGEPVVTVHFDENARIIKVRTAHTHDCTVKPDSGMRSTAHAGS